VSKNSYITKTLKMPNPALFPYGMRQIATPRFSALPAIAK